PPRRRGRRGVSVPIREAQLNPRLPRRGARDRPLGTQPDRRRRGNPAGVRVRHRVAALHHRTRAAADETVGHAAHRVRVRARSGGAVLAAARRGRLGGRGAGGRLLLRPALRVVARAQVSEVFTAAALLTVIATALLANLAGLSMALGAFLAGVLLADSEFRHELEADLEPFKGLLLGLFFIAVG